MMDLFQPADYAIAGLAVTLAVMGLFRGFSGMVAFGSASAAAAVTGSFSWGLSEPYFERLYVRGIAVLLCALLAFWIVRVFVRKLVNGLLAQPADSIFGLFSGLLVAALVPVGWALSGFYLEYSHLASEVAKYVG